MNIYSIALFLHIVGALGFFISLGLEWTGLRHIGSARTPELVGQWMPIFKSTRRLGIVSMLAILVTGLYMTLRFWGGAGWIIVTLGALVLGVVLTLALTGPRMAAVGRALSKEHGPVSQTFQALTNHPILWISIQTRVAIALGIVLLKIIKPDLGGSLVTIAIAIVLGLVSALPMPRRQQAQARPAE